MAVLEFNITDPAFRSDPYPTYDHLRATDPVHYRPQRDDWVLTRHADVLRVLRDDRFGHPPLPPDPVGSASGRAIGLGAAVFRRVHDRQRARHLQLQWMLFHDPPKHTVLRSLFQDSFAPPQAEAWRETIEGLTDDLVASVAGREQVDVILDLAYPLPAMVIAEVFGLPRRDWGRFREWTRALVPALDEHAGTMGSESARQALLGFTEYFEDVIRQHRRQPQPGLFTVVLEAAGRAGLSDDELIANVAFVFLAGQENVQHMIGNSLMALWDHPDQLRRLHDDPALLGSAVEELTRFETSVQLTSRQALTDVEIGGRSIRQGQTVLLSIGAANRDPAKFDDPATLDITRSPNAHLAFSSGPHYCLGAALARLEIRAMLGAILRRYPGIHLTGPPPVRFDHFLVRGYRALPAALGPLPAVSR
ncbi:MAG: hypothetical protein QOH36_1541 [Actinomycetota bacterium]|nr:hypothetical protein [Actinomycetota bacterium]